MENIDLLIAPQTKEFARLSRRFFEYLEKLPDKDISVFWTAQLRFLSEIYKKVLALPQIEAHYSPDVEKYITEQDYNDIFIKLISYIGTMDRFSDFSDLRHPGKVKVIEASVSEMLADIYQELKDFTLLYETGTLENMNDAIVECIESFAQHWGVKLLSATRIMHVNLYQQRYVEAKKKSQKYGELGEDDDDDDDDDYDLLEEVDYYDGMDD